MINNIAVQQPARKPDSMFFKAFRRPLIEILNDLRQPIKTRFIKHKNIKGNSIAYVSWYDLNRLLDFYAPGFDWDVSTSFDGSRVSVIGSITLKTEEGDFSRSATGSEISDIEAYGDAYSNAEAQAFRRCCAKWGLGLHLWG